MFFGLKKMFNPIYGGVDNFSMDTWLKRLFYERKLQMKFPH